MQLKKIGILIMTLALSLGSATIYASNEESNLMEESVKADNNQVTMEGQTLGLAEVENARQLGGYYKRRMEEESNPICCYVLQNW